jgi:RluA family pseudouridine synthase
MRLPEALQCLDPSRYRTKSQAKKACRFGFILIFRADAICTALPDEAPARFFRQTNKNVSRLSMFGEESISGVIVGDPASVVHPGDVVAIQTRTPDEFYSVSVTKFILPPLVFLEQESVEVVYEDDDLAVVHKPENLTTIGTEREDLQSVLGFILHPSSLEPTYHPRPVHRLDRRTSGLVLVAKTQASMRFLSKAFMSRNITKTYSALIFGNETTRSEDSWQTINYPIDGRSAISEWRVVQSSPDQTLALVQVRPHTGRTHQIRRHLAYCLGSPIVGDAKYDKGARPLRTNGMYLCCHALEFPHPARNPSQVQNNKQMRSEQYSTVEILEDQCGIMRVKVAIPLPSKFHERLEDP